MPFIVCVKTIKYIKKEERGNTMKKQFKEENIGWFNIMAVDISNSSLEIIVTDIIRKMGVPAHLKGYYYLREAIVISVENINAINSITTMLYPTIARKYSSTSSCVERDIRHAINIAWKKGNRDVLNSLQ